MEGKVDVREFSEYFVQYLREQDLVIMPRQIGEAERLRESYLRKKSLTYKEIADANLWGDIGKKAVETIAKRQVQQHAIFQRGNTFRIMISEVERIARNRGTI